MKERPILFNGPMVRAILDGSKTQTRRVMKPQLGDGSPPECEWLDCGVEPERQRYGCHGPLGEWPCPYGGPGDRLWMRSAYRVRYNEQRNSASWTAPGVFIETHGRPRRKDGKLMQLGAKPSIHMPYWLSVEAWPLLKITGVRVERVQEITDTDARAEGCEPIYYGSAVSAVEPFAELWDSINAKSGNGWDANPWVWVVSFRRVSQ